MPPGTGAALDDEGEQATALILIEALNKAPFVLALRYLAFAAFSVLLYDYLLTFPDEVAYFWQGRKTWPSLLFFLNRYLPILATLFNMIAGGASERYGQLWLKGLLTWAPAVEIFASHCILAARLNAVYGNKRNVRIILAACLSVATAGYVSILVWNVAQMKVTSHPLPHLAPNLRVCFSQHLAQVAWTLLPVLVFEIVCFTALVHKVLRQLKNDHGSYGFGHHCKSSCPHCRNGIVNCNFKRAQRTLHHVILRDNFVYFMIAICIFAAEAAMWSRLSPPESELMDYPAVAIVSILSNRMLFNIRAQAERNGFHGSSLGTLTAAAVAMLSEADRAAMEKRSEELDDIPMRTVPKPTRKSKNEKMGKRLKSESTWDGDEIRMELERMALDRVRSYDFEGPATYVVGGVVCSTPGSKNARQNRTHPEKKASSSLPVGGHAGQTASAASLTSDPEIQTAGSTSTVQSSNTRDKGKRRMQDSDPAFSQYDPMRSFGSVTSGSTIRPPRTPTPAADTPFQHVLALSLQNSRAESLPPDAAQSESLRAQTPSQPATLLAEPRVDVESEATSVYGSFSSRKGPRPRTPSNASSDLSMPWHIPEFVTFEDQRQLPSESV